LQVTVQEELCQPLRVEQKSDKQGAVKVFGTQPPNPSRQLAP